MDRGIGCRTCGAPFSPEEWNEEMERAMDRARLDLERTILRGSKPHLSAILGKGTT